MATFIDNSEDDQILQLQQHICMIRGEDATSAAFTKMQGLVARHATKEALETLLSQHDVVLGNDTGDAISTFFTLLVYLTKLLTIEEGDAVISDLAKAISAGDSTAVVRLNVLVIAYNALHVDSKLRAALFLTIVQYALRTGNIALVKPHLFQVDALMSSWRHVTVAERQDILRVVAGALKSIGEEMAAHAVLVKLLSTFESAPRDALATIRGDALAVIVEAIAFEKVFRLDHLADMAAIKQLHGDAEFGSAYELLRVFVAGRLSDYVAFKASHQGYVERLGLDDAKATRKIRLLSLASLAASADEITYDTIAATLSVPKADVESWVLLMLTTDLAELSMDQLAEIVYVVRATPREFNHGDWAEIARRLKGWRSAVTSMLQIVDSHRSDAADE
eukprot:Amastigsp_a250_252.p1 type:complete len:393 gc:universal Amastigsp_a250_252:1404-226(-)